MIEQSLHLLGIERRASGYVCSDSFGFGLYSKLAGQMVKGLLANPVDQVLGRIESGRVGRRMHEIEFQVLQSLPVRALQSQFSEERQYAFLGFLAMRLDIIEHHRDVATSSLQPE